MDEKIEKRYKKRFKIESVVKSIMVGLSTGCLVNMFIAFIVWFCGFVNGAYWWGIGAGITAFVVSTPIYYFCRFRPTPEYMAKRLDRILGLEERMVTMHEFKGVNSAMNTLQRANAIATLGCASTKAFTTATTVAMCIASGVAAVCIGASTGMTSAAVLMDEGHFMSGSEIITRPSEIRHELVYEATPGGYIEGNAIQSVSDGSSGEGVTAVPDDGWMFDHWEYMVLIFPVVDESCTTPYRLDKNITEDATYTAVFVMVVDGEDYQPPIGPGDEDSDGDDEPKDYDGDDGSGGGGASGNIGDNNNILDGKTPYGDEFGEYYNEMMEYLNNNDSLSDEQRRVLEEYFKALK